jgi:large-conductance mechanosensitive channel
MNFALLWYLLLVGGFVIGGAFRKNMSNLQNIIISQAIISSVANKLNLEIVNDSNLLYEFRRLQYNPYEDVIYGLIIAGSLYSQYKYISYIDNKLQNIDVFLRTQRNTNAFMLAFIMIFSKNIENAL